MSKYSFDRITPGDFESMSQALLEKTYRIGGDLKQFGAGADGAREATWTQPTTHPDYCRPSNLPSDLPKEWVFQVKYHDIGQRGWTAARDAVVDDLEKELDKIVHKHKVPCHAYVLITNVPFTGVRDLGTRDKISTVAKGWVDHIPEIFVWDAADLSRMLDANESVRTAYIDTILPGDLIKAICKGATFHADRSKSALIAYLKFVTEREGVARAEEAGDEPGLPLVDVFIDLTMSTRHKPFWDITNGTTILTAADTGRETRFLPKDYSKTPSSFALLIAEHDRMLLLGGPGLGKSTLTQFAAIYHAARLVAPAFARTLASKLKLPEGFTPEDLDAHCRLRLPFRIELRRYAQWMGEEQKKELPGEMALYIAEMLINRNVSSTLNMDDVFAIAANDPILLILDGLDEVPHPEARKQILENLHVFLRRVQAENGDIQLLFSSRPKGYSGEFTVFEPFTWELNNLDREDFNDYCERWLNKRIRDAAEKIEAQERIDRGMKSEAVQRLAESLLQATVMLTIVRRKNEIPHQRHALYAKYVEVIFDREKLKSQVVRDHEVILNRLHERVGFELHRKMEQTKVEALDPESFRSYVLNVLEDYSGLELGSRKLGEVANDIITAATDRLCLLVGKGKEQADIDFVVQSYREYFAAVYLFNHPDADPDRVFQTLVRRGGYWANVLQFYVAQANANQQMRWITNADDGNLDPNLVDTLVDFTRTRRALVNVLPEFNLQRNSDFDRALRTIFHTSTRWTWLKQESVLELMRVIRSGSARKTLTELFNPMSCDAGTLAVELWLRAGLASHDVEEREKVSVTIESLLEQDHAGPVSLASALENNMVVDLSRCNISTFSLPGVVRDSNLSPNLFARQNSEKQCELLLAQFDILKKPKPPTCLAARIKDVLSSNAEVKLFNKTVTFRLAPYIIRTPETITPLTEISDAIDASGNQSEVYFRALVCAAMDPANLDLDSHARTMKNPLKEEHIGLWDPDTILGPSVDAFSTPEDWKAFKNELIDINSAEPDWHGKLQALPDLDSVWIALLFHTEEWPLLVDENLLSKTAQTALYNSPFGRMLSRSMNPINPFEVLSFGSNIKYQVPLGGVLRVALQIVENKGIERIGSGWILSALLSYCGTDTITKTEAESLLRRALASPPLPSAWVAAFMHLSLQAGAEVVLLLQLWRHGSLPNNHFDLPEAELSEGWNDLVANLLAMEHPDALHLASRILMSGRTRHDIARRFINKLISYPTTNKDENYARIRSLLSQAPSLEEFQFWVHPDQATGSGCWWLFWPLLKRFEEAVEAENPLDATELRKCLITFINRRCDFSWHIPIAALEAIIKLDERNVPPLQDAEWQQEL